MSTSWLLLCAVARADLVFDPSVERVIVNVGSNTQPSLSHDPQTVAIAVEPMVGCRIREQRNLHVLHAAVAANNTLAFMQWYNKFGESSSLGTATEKAEYTTRYRGKRKIVNVISLTTLVESIPLTVKLWYLKTDMQGFDFDALRSAADILRSGRAQYVMSEVWWDRYQSYAGQNNDFCLHQYPLMRALGYELVDVENGYQSNKYHGIERLKTLDTKQIRSHDEILKMCSMQVDAPDKAGKCNEGDAYWKHASATLPPPRWREQTENPKRRRLMRLDGRHLAASIPFSLCCLCRLTLRTPNLAPQRYKQCQTPTTRPQPRTKKSSIARAAMASHQTLEALAAWARTFEGSENATTTSLSKDLATAFSIISETPCTPHNLLRRLKRWYAQELSRDVSSLIDEASDDVVKQASLVLGAAVQGSQREHHITIIMGLDDTVQSELMILVQSIMNTTAQAPSCSVDDVHEEDRWASMQEIARLKDEKTQLHEKNNEALEKERRKSELSLQARDEALQAKSAAEKTLEKVRSTLRACELREERCQREKLELTKKCERLEASLSSSSDAHKTLSDELDVARARARDADAAEARVLKLKKKLDDVNSSQRELQELDEANARHVQEITRLEVLLSSREKRDADVDQLRVEKAALDQRVFDLNKACEDKDEELRRLTLQKEESDAQRRFFEDELASARPAPQSPEQMAPVFEESASELRDRLRDAQRNVARLEAEAEARADSDASEIGSLRDRIADLEFEKAQLQERPPPPPPSPSLDATQRMHALALKDATIADLRKRIESNTDLEELKRRYDEASKAAIRDREAQDATIIDLEKRLASVATERDQIIGDLQRHLAEESTNTLNAVAAQDATIADLRRRLANNTSEGIAERDSIIADLRERIARNASSPAVEDALGDLRQRVAEAQQQTAAELAERDATIAKLTSDREKLETYTKKTLGNVQEKYSVLVQTYKNQIRDKQERISRLEGELERHRRELASSREFSAVTPNGGGGETCV